MTMRPLLSRVLTGLALATVPGLAWAAPAGGEPLLAHRAVYDLTLLKATGSSAPATARGRIVYEFSGSACEGYVTNFRQITETTMDEGGMRMSDMRSSTFEEGDGSGFRYKTDTYVDGRLVESVDGQARKTPDGAISVDLTKPVKAKANLPTGPVFPTAQILQIVQDARKGDHTAELKVFDGSDNGQKAFDTLTVIGPSNGGPPAEKTVSDNDALKSVERWPVSISYFDPNKRDAPPNYVLGFDLYANGVSGNLRIDYGNYVLSGQMTKLELLPQKQCK